MLHKKKKNVKVGQQGARRPTIQVEEPVNKPRRQSFMHSYTVEINQEVEERNKIKVLDIINKEEVNVTPKVVKEEEYTDKFQEMQEKVAHLILHMPTPLTNAMRVRSSGRMGMTGMKQSMDDIIYGIGEEPLMLSKQDSYLSLYEEDDSTPYTKKFLRITLRITEDILLFEQRSLTAERGTAEGDVVERENKHYDFLTIGKGKIRRRSEADAQTDEILTKSRDVNTIDIRYDTQGTYVSNSEMYDTFNNLGRKEGGASRVDDIIRISDVAPYQNDERLWVDTDFLLTKMLLGRCISSNVYEMGQRRFRNFESESYKQEDSYYYVMRVLFRCVPRPSKKERKAVSDISFCTSNGDIVAVGYGIFSYSAQHVPNSGDVFIWSIKNPGEPERAYYFKVPVTAVQFSPYIPSLLAIGLFDGSVEVRDITNPHDPPVAISQRSSSPGSAPVVALRWIKQNESDDVNEIDPMLSLSQNGSVTRFRVIKSPFLLGFNQMVLERVEGHPEGLKVIAIANIKQEANRHPQGLNLTAHPLYPDIYYILTDEGCLHKCSTNYQHQYLEVLKTHEGAVTCMEFSPWSPKLFLTCGNDWCVRIWIEGIFKPLITLKNRFGPIHCALWSPTHSTIIVSINRKSCDIWDIRRNILKPMASHNMDSSFNTMAQFSRCGKVVAVGNERGNLLMCALDNMPLAPHFQYDELEKAVYRAIGNDQEMLIELKSVGFFGYPKKRYVKPN